MRVLRISHMYIKNFVQNLKNVIYAYKIARMSGCPEGPQNSNFWGECFAPLLHLSRNDIKKLTTRIPGPQHRDTLFETGPNMCGENRETPQDKGSGIRSNEYPYPKLKHIANDAWVADFSYVSQKLCPKLEKRSLRIQSGENVRLPRRAIKFEI